MISKEIELNFGDSNAMARINSDSDTGLITLSITEFEKDEEKSKPFHDVYEACSTTEIYLGDKEIKYLIKALENSLSEDDAS